MLAGASITAQFARNVEKSVTCKYFVNFAHDGIGQFLMKTFWFIERISSIIFPEWMLPKCNCLSCKRNVYSGKRQSMEILYQTEKRLSLNQSSPRTYEFSRRKLKIMSIEFLTCSHFEIFSFDVLSLSSFRAKQSQSDVG